MRAAPPRGEAAAAGSGGDDRALDLPIGAGHPAFKELVRIRRGSAPAGNSRVMAEGLWAVQLVLRLGTRIERFFWCPELAYSEEARACAAAATKRARASFQVSARSMHRISDRDAPEGLLALVRQPRWPADQFALGDGALIVVADGLENPGNLGTLLRTADGAGAELVVVTNRRARPDHPQVFRASHGMSLKVPQVEFARVEDAVAWLRQHGCTVYLAAPGGGAHYRQLDCGGRTALVFGGERFGLSPTWANQGFRRVAIPMLGAADSLNVAAAAAVLLYEVRACKHGWNRRTETDP